MYVDEFHFTYKLLLDTVSKDDFHVEKVIGKGAFGTVYLVIHNATEHVYAMKVVSKELLLMSDQDESIKGKELYALDVLYCGLYS